MVLYKPDCDSNDCELPNGKITPSIVAIYVTVHDKTNHIVLDINLRYRPTSNLTDTREIIILANVRYN